MRILLTSHSYVPQKDGVQFVNKYIAEGLAKRGHEVTIITYMCPDKTKVKDEIINDIRVIRWDVKTRRTFHLGDKKGYQEYIIKHQDEFDVILNVGTQTALTDWLFPIFEKIKIPKILYIHSIWDFSWNLIDKSNLKESLPKLWANIRWYLYYKKNKKIFQKYDEIIQLHERDYSVKYFLDNYNIKSKILENAVEDEFFTKESINKDKKYIIYVANFVKIKNQEAAIKYFLSANISDDWEMFLVGSKNTNYLNEIKKYEKRVRAENNITDKRKINYIVGATRSEIQTLVRNASLFLMTSSREAFPISLLETMAAGVPFISSDVGIVKYFTGGIVAKSEGEFVEYLEKFTKSQKLRDEYGRKGHFEAIKRYKIEDKVLGIEESIKLACLKKNKGKV